MKTTLLTIPMPLSAKEYEVGLRWSFNEQSRLETGGGEGVEVVVNTEFTDKDFGSEKNLGKLSGQYTYKIYHLETKLPPLIKKLVKPMLGKNACQLHEESWVSFPFCKTVLTNPTYMGEDFKVTIESYHLDNDRGDTRGLLGYPKDVSVKVLDIIGDKNKLPTPEDVRVRATCSAKAGRGNLGSGGDWIKTSEPIMTAYKFITVHFNRFGMQKKLEDYTSKQYRKILLAFHKQIWCWVDNWIDLELSEVKKLEHETAEELKKKRLESEQKVGINMDDSE